MSSFFNALIYYLFFSGEFSKFIRNFREFSRKRPYFF